MYNINNSMMQTQQIIDERSVLQRMNRISLYYLLKVCGFDVVDTMAKDKMLKLSEAHPEKIDMRKVQTYNDGFGGIRVVRPERFKSEDAENQKVFEKEKSEYDGKSKKQLLDMAKEMGVEADYKMKTEELVALIMAKKAALKD